MVEDVDFQDLFMRLLASLSLAENMDDVREDLRIAIKQAGLIHVEWETQDDLVDQLGEMGVVTLCGVPLAVDEKEVEDETPTIC